MNSGLVFASLSPAVRIFDAAPEPEAMACDTMDAALHAQRVSGWIYYRPIPAYHRR